MAINQSKSFAYDSVAYQGRFLLPQDLNGTGVTGAAGTLGKQVIGAPLTVYGCYAMTGTATGTSTYTVTSTGATALTTATITGGQTITPYIVTIRGTTTTTTTYSNALFAVGTGTPQSQSALVTSEGGVNVLPGDTLYSLTGTDATANTRLIWEVSMGALANLTNN